MPDTNKTKTFTDDKPKKSFWDVLDSLLPSATAVYGRIRESQTGSNPFDTSEEDVRDGRLPARPTTFTDDTDTNTKKGKGTLVITAVVLVGLGVGTYFYIKKRKQ